jgi:hypothetical protein
MCQIYSLLSTVDCYLNNHDAVETATLGTDIVMCADSYELEIARNYCFDQLLNNGILGGSPYKPSRDGKEY